MNITGTAPEWERTLDAFGWVPAVDENAVGDTDYLLARLRDIIAEAAKGLEQCRASDDRDVRGAADYVELSYLRRGVERLAAELRPFGRAGEEMLAMLRRRFPNIEWERVRDGFRGTEHFQTLTPGEVAPRCARALRLPEIEAIGDRPSRGWQGPHEGFTITVHRRADDARRRGPSAGIDAELVAWLIAHAPDLPPIAWDSHGYVDCEGGDYRRLTLRGDVYDFVHPNPAEVAAQWADALALGSASALDENGDRFYLADTAVGLIQVRWIADQERHDARVRETEARVAGASSGGDA